jgi:hypothetical protein
MGDFKLEDDVELNGGGAPSKWSSEIALANTSVATHGG